MFKDLRNNKNYTPQIQIKSIFSISMVYYLMTTVNDYEIVISPVTYTSKSLSIFAT